MLLDVPLELDRLALAALGKGSIATPPCHIGESREHVVQEEAEPDTLALALFAHEVHAVVPVAASPSAAGRGHQI